ncbi:MAG: hypothetical protein SO161_01725 [Treponema sp.]|nr:hypothetical protein [Treponema sp.]MDY4831228.1 hypothetical protein [Treponema sp.]
MTAIKECSELIQKCRNIQLDGTITKEENELLKKLGTEWKIVYPICKKCESLLPIIEIFQMKNFKHSKKEQEKF